MRHVRIGLNTASDGSATVLDLAAAGRASAAELVQLRLLLCSSHAIR